MNTHDLLTDCDHGRQYELLRKETIMKCKCGFKFAGAGEFRNCEAFITSEGQGGVICPECQTAYVNGNEVKLEEK